MMPLLHGHLLDFLLTVDKNRPICEELVLGNSTLKKPTWANAELYGGNHSHRAFQTHISTGFVHDMGFPRKGVASVASRMTMHQPILEGGRGVGGLHTHPSDTTSTHNFHQRIQQRLRPTPCAERTTGRPIPPYAMV